MLVYIIHAQNFGVKLEKLGFKKMFLVRELDNFEKSSD